MRIGIIGLGRMGRPIADHLAKTHTVTVLPPRAGYGGPLPVAADAAALSAISDVIVTCLRSAEEVAALLPDLLRSGVLHIDHTSGDPRRSRDFAAAWRDSGGDYIDAALSGTPDLAAQGALKVLAGGTDALLDRLRDICAPYAAEVIHAGETGSGHALRLVAGMMGFGIAALSAEMLVLADRTGIDPALVHRMITGTGADSRTFQSVHSALHDKSKARALPVAQVTRDLGVLAAIRPAGTPHHMLDAMRATYDAVPADSLISDIAAVLKGPRHD